MKVQIITFSQSFNTSHVVVYPARPSSPASLFLRFNTSHVVVYRLIPPFVAFILNCFNTSHVVVYQVKKYSLQGTTQGRYLTGGVPPVRFSM